MSNEAAGQHLQAEMSRIYRQHIVPLIEQYCTELSTPGLLHRIESLELDLGVVDPQNLERDLTKKVRAQLLPLLSEAIASQERTAEGSEANLKITSQLELLSLFATTGMLPWWADASQPRLLHNCVSYLLRNAPARLRELLHDPVQAPTSLQRIIHHLPDQLLADLAAMLIPPLQITPLAEVVRDLTALLQQIDTRTGHRQLQVRSLVWSGLLRVQHLSGAGTWQRHDIYRALLQHLYRELGVSYGELLTNVQRVTQQDRLHWHNLVTELGEVLEKDLAHRQGPSSASTEEALRDSRAGGNPDHDKAASIDLTFSDVDALYIDNAGVVILHPFLRSFFERLGLLEDKQFKDLAARQRAIGLLQYVVSEDPSPPEYLLPLHKVLCGLELDEMFDFGPPVTDAEAEECNNLLTAVIANASILKNMSVNGLRSTFLLRHGVLSSRDGAWLLRVERETYDVVLDRLPWTLQWVKLPWMDVPLRVEW